MSSWVAASDQASKLVVPFDVARPPLQETINDAASLHEQTSDNLHETSLNCSIVTNLA